MNEDGPFGLAMLLVLLAGWVDAGLSISRQPLLSFMIGNTTDLPGAVVYQNWAEIRTIAAIVALFIASVGFGEVLNPGAVAAIRPLF